jgi:hypothetical protein
MSRDVPAVARAMLDRLGPKAMATLETMLDDPKLDAKNRLEVIKLIMSRYMPEPKIDSAASARRNPIMLTATATEVSQLMTKAQARIQAQPVELEDAEDEEDHEEETKS